MCSQPKPSDWFRTWRTKSEFAFRLSPDAFFSWKFAQTALNSFLAQSYKGEMELVVIDNSADDEMLWRAGEHIQPEGVVEIEGFVGFKAPLGEHRTLKHVSLPHRPIGALRNTGNWHAGGTSSSILTVMTGSTLTQWNFK